ncbi:MAG: ABC transporter substrate-binding protein [Cellvibrionales bacterium]|nr:ABC transporter substrate-binding protein [Cellvibrionales bacterium]
MAPQKSYNYLYREVKKNQIIKPQLDALLTLKPSLVLAGSHTKKSLLHGLGNLGLSTVIIEPAYTFEGIRENLGKLLNQEKKAASLLREFDTRLDLLSDQSKGKPDQTAIFYAPNGFTHGRGTMYDAILSAAGLSNLAAELGIQGHGYISLETLLWYEPDIIILEDDFSENHSLSQQMLNHPALKRALLQSRLIYVNANKLRCPDFSSLLAVEQILEQR